MIIGVLENYGGAFGRGISNNLYYNNTTSGLTAATIKGAIDELASGKQDTLTAGTGIDITNGVISATGGSGGGSSSSDILTYDMPSNDISENTDLATLSAQGKYPTIIYYGTNKIPYYLIEVTGSAVRYGAFYYANVMAAD